jgi:predicted GNAT family acetyltransferase
MPANFSVNQHHQRFELVEAGLIAFADYRRQGTSLVIPHVESPPALRGKGTADRLMRAIAAYAREQHLVITPLCGYARAWFRRHSEEQDLLDAGPPPRDKGS